MSKPSRIIVDKLNKYEQVAYDGGCGTDYLSELGEGVKFYFMECDNNNVEPTIENFLEWVDRFAKGYLDID